MAAKADTCPTPEEFIGSNSSFYRSPNGDFALGAGKKPIAFAGAVFMYPSEPIKKLRYGKLSASLYLLNDGTKKLALLQGEKTKVAAITDNSTTWKKHIDERGNERNNRYDCNSDNDIEACQFNLYYLKQ